MAKRVIIIASGETERRALPHLSRHLENHSVTLIEIRIPPHNRAIDAVMAERLIKAAWYANLHDPPDKFVLLIDLDGSDPETMLEPIRSRISKLRRGISADILCAYAQQQLEAWYFADAQNLREYLHRGLGQVDTSQPDDIRNPKLHLKNLLRGRIYTARLSEEIARSLDASTIARRSPSFKNFVGSLTNGATSRET